MQAPTLSTDRLLLRAHRLQDFDDSAAMWSAPEVVRHIGGRPFTAEESWSRLLRYHGLWPALGYGYWVVVDRETGRFAGEVGLADFHRDMTPALTVPEAGWALVPSCFGRGYASEALSLVLAWADAHLPAAETACIIAGENRASLRVAEKAGYRNAGTARYRDTQLRLFTRSKPYPSHAPSSPGDGAPCPGSV